MPTTNKQHTLTQTLTVLKRHYDEPPAEADPKPVFEQLIYGVIREGATRAQADAAFRRLQERFFDWNEIRVSSVAEIEDALEDLPGSSIKAPRVIGILQEVFESTFSFKLDDIDKKGLKNAAKQLGRMADVTDFAAAWVMQQALGGHAIPLDEPTMRVLRRLGVVDSDAEQLESIRTTLEHYIPKAKGPFFNEVISLLAKDHCVDPEPRCTGCPMKKDCSTGQVHKESEPRRLKPR